MPKRKPGRPKGRAEKPLRSFTARAKLPVPELYCEHNFHRLLQDEKPTLEKVNKYRMAKGVKEPLPMGSLLYALYPESKVSDFVTNEVFQRCTEKFIPIGTDDDVVLRQRANESQASSSSSERKKAQIIINHATRFDVLIRHHNLLRGEDVRAMEFSQLFAEIIDPTLMKGSTQQCLAFVYRLTHGKTNQYGRNQYAACYQFAGADRILKFGWSSVI
ncbi:hypothetical protein DFQ26_009693 [Actinomortierella ambigua]|nr:hypothetical protein DFQ26_009693 [Actinomortierella ambigua]